MERLGSRQREALERLQGILGSRSYDVDVLMNVLQTLDWNVQVPVLQIGSVTEVDYNIACNRPACERTG